MLGASVSELLVIMIGVKLMKRAMLIAMLAAGPVTAQDDDADGDVNCQGLSTQTDISICAQGHRDFSEQDLTVAYDMALAAVGESIRQPQRDWIARREADCTAEASMYEGGSMWGAATNLCFARWNRMRAVGLLEVASGQTPLDAIDRYDAPE